MKDDNNKVEICIKGDVEPAEKGKPAQVGDDIAEYEAPKSSPVYTASPCERYIIGEADKPFAVHFGCLEGYEANGWPAISIDILIDDAIHAGHPVYVTKKQLKKYNFTYYLKGKSRKPLLFNVVTLEELGSLGTIVVKVQRTTAQYVKTGFGGYWNTDRGAEFEDGQVLTYKFFYGSKATLDSLGLIQAKSSYVIHPPMPKKEPIPAAPRLPPKRKSTSKRSSLLPNDDDVDAPAFTAPTPETQIPACASATHPASEHAREHSPNSLHEGPNDGEVRYTSGGLPHTITTAGGQDKAMSLVDRLAANRRNMLNARLSIGMPPNPYASTPLGKRKQLATESISLASDHDDEESQLAKKLRTETPAVASTPYPTPFPSSNSTYATSTPGIKVESPAADDVTELSEVSAEGWTHARRVQDRAREAELAKRKRDLKKQYELKLARIEYDYEMEEIEANERLTQG